jgi:ribonuclease T
MKELYISVDIESSGPVIGVHSMLQIGACIVGDVERNFNGLLIPITDHVDEQAMKIVGKPLSYFKEHGVDPINVIAQFGSWLQSIGEGAKPVFVGFNAAFDWGFTNWYFLRYGDAGNPFGYAPLDIKAYYAGLTGCSWEETRSSRIDERFKPPGEHTHDALSDAIEQAEMFRLMLESR